MSRNNFQFRFTTLLLLLGAVVCVTVLSACQIQNPTSTALTSFLPTVPALEAEPFRVIGYITAGAVIETLPFDKLTHINYAFLIPESDGSLQPFPNSWKLDALVKLAHQEDVKVLISVGGWGYDAEFESLAADPESRRAFVNHLIQFVADHNLDGIDMDWEYPDLVSQRNFLALMQDIRNTLPKDKLLTAAVVAAGDNGEGVSSEVFELVDFLNLMVYDGPQHATMGYAHTALNYWSERGLSKEKTVIGVPFYSQPFFIPYHRLVQNDPIAANLDTFTYNGTEVNYNGIPTIKEKTSLAMEEASGIMIWTLEYDAKEEKLSLLNAIHETAALLQAKE